MIRVTIELVPFGREEEKETLQTIEIANVGQVSDKISYYDSNIDGEHFAWTSHRRSDGVLKLIKKVFSEAEIKKPQ